MAQTYKLPSSRHYLKFNNVSSFHISFQKEKEFSFLPPQKKKPKISKGVTFSKQVEKQKFSFALSLPQKATTFLPGQIDISF
jgi:hypothetical protein